MAEQFARVLRPGGRAIVLDSDHPSRVMSALDDEVEAKIIAAFMRGRFPTHGLPGWSRSSGCGPG
jgi:hypothetical protein